METKSLKKYWEEIQNFFSMDAKSAQAIFDMILEDYSESNRTYHNLNHLSFILTEIDKHQLSVENRLSLILACFFHDIIYITGSCENEFLSAKKLNRIFDNLEMVHPIVTAASKIIFDTKEHRTYDPLSQLFLDIDLSILGQSKQLYADYVLQVRQEWHQTPDWLFRQGRKLFARNMMKRPQIFFTLYYYQKYEVQARVNLSNELKNGI